MKDKSTTANDNCTTVWWRDQYIPAASLDKPEQGRGVAPCKLNTSATTGCLEVTHSLQVSSDLTWQSCIHGHPVTRKNCSLLSHLPSMLTSCAMLTTLIDILETSRICQRNPDNQFIPLQKERQGVFKDASGSSTVAYVGSITALTVKGQTVPETIWRTLWRL